MPAAQGSSRSEVLVSTRCWPGREKSTYVSRAATASHIEPKRGRRKFGKCTKPYRSLRPCAPRSRSRGSRSEEGRDRLSVAEGGLRTAEVAQRSAQHSEEHLTSLFHLLAEVTLAAGLYAQHPVTGKALRTREAPQTPTTISTEPPVMLMAEPGQHRCVTTDSPEPSH